ncbi:MAG: DEAD/DEAH box helicase [archaeon]|jgi:ATP-dependent RNA helicase DeaD|nr:DEAD/DEAH box helicase [archaeon]MDD2478054.1 DEAD/DEAH box helicase [Candidatus ainarchaeum sp.]MDD3084608.1 DEAD/DEAH box helicase [Candidatus ainarchaeum sp.]MDD4221103.1 DEAD/DEAH box helicase [Candidatus ainarchaeum sp.]MDD4662590.1 DEAD/DEAH box helicase [Candidatus ainarchaeum sp.]
MNEFKKLGLDDDVLKVVKEFGFEYPTEVQEKTIPMILKGDNVIAQSATGTGKTLAFLAGILQTIEPKKEIQAIIITPTRELANQIYEETIKLAKYKKLNACVVYGGVSIINQRTALKKAQIVITTPGRFIDHINRRNIENLDATKIIVLDEADRMCDMGFYDDITKIIDKAKNRKQILLFSATITRDVTKLERKYMHNSKRVVVDFYVDPSKLKQEFYVVKSNEKISLLIDIILQKIEQKAIIFCNTRSTVDLIEQNLNANGIKALKLHGGMEQKKRSNIIDRYQKEKSAILVSTDVSARGIHIDDLDFIYNFDLPKDRNQYIHRIGRTARAGKDGKAISFLHKEEVREFLQMAKKFDFIIEEQKLPDFKIINIVKPLRTRQPKDNYTKSSYTRNRSSFARNRGGRGDREVEVKTLKFNDLDKFEKEQKEFRKKRVSHLKKHVQKRKINKYSKR